MNLKKNVLNPDSRIIFSLLSRERDINVREKHWLVAFSWVPRLTRDQNHKPSIFADWKSNPQPCGPWANWATLASVLLWTFNGVNSSSIFRVRKFFGMTRFFSLTFLNVQSHIYTVIHTFWIQDTLSLTSTIS